MKVSISALHLLRINKCIQLIFSRFSRRAIFNTLVNDVRLTSVNTKYEHPKPNSLVRLNNFTLLLDEQASAATFLINRFPGSYNLIQYIRRNVSYMFS